MTKLTSELKELKAIKSTFPRSTNGRILYTNDFRKRLVELMESKSMDVTQTFILRELEIAHVVFNKWRSDFKEHGYNCKRAVAVSRKQGSSAVSTLQAKRAELLGELTKIDQAIKLLNELGV